MNDSELREYPNPRRLEGDSGVCFAIPSSIIFEDDPSGKLVSAFSFFSVSRGLNCKAMFTLNAIAEWDGKKPSRVAGGTNSKFADAISVLADKDYLSLDGDLSNTKCCIATFNKDKVSKECDDGRFAVVYLDELNMMLGWSNENKKDVSLTNDTLLRVFAYLRMLIYRRRNRLMPEEKGRGSNLVEDVAIRRKKSPDAYNGYYQDMAEELGISPRVMSKAVEVLCNMGLLYSEPLPRMKINGRWKTTHTVFCNAYKREGQYLLASGSEYYGVEIANKKKKLNIIGSGYSADEN